MSGGLEGERSFDRGLRQARTLHRMSGFWDGYRSFRVRLGDAEDA